MKTKIIGVGGGATNILSYISRKSKFMKSTELVSINTDRLARLNNELVHYLYLGDESVANGTNGDPALAQQAFNSSNSEIFATLKDSKDIFVIACLGGGTGSGVTPDLIKMIKSLKLPFFVVVTMPMNFEKRQELAEHVLKTITKQTTSIRVIYLEEEFEFALNSKDMSLKDLFAKVSGDVKSIFDSWNM